MKLFVWCNPYSVNYGSSMVFAIAKNEKLARKEAAKGFLYKYSQYQQKGNFLELADKLGKPDRIVDVPCAEWHEWSE